jgi:hypothetical protein
LLTAYGLEGCKAKYSFFVLPYNKVDHPIAEVAYTVEQNNGMLVHPTKVFIQIENPASIEQGFL